MALAIFDLDNTLIAGDSDHSWGEFLINKGLVEAEYYQQQNDGFYQAYQAGTLNITEYLHFALEPLTRLPIDKLNDLHNEFMDTYIEPLMLPKACALLHKHKRQGDYLLIITATNAFITRPIAKRLCVDDILATEPETKNNRFTGRFLGIPCFQEGKVANLEAWLKNNQQSLEGSYFYSDSINDLPLLERVTFPVAVNADEKLTKIAESSNWPQLDLRG